MTDKKSTERSLDDDHILKMIGDKVRTIRKKHPDYANYEVFAYFNKINKVTLANIEKGANYNISSLLKVLKALGISVEDFFNGIK